MLRVWAVAGEYRLPVSLGVWQQLVATAVCGQNFLY